MEKELVLWVHRFVDTTGAKFTRRENVGKSHSFSVFGEDIKKLVEQANVEEIEVIVTVCPLQLHEVVEQLEDAVELFKLFE